MDYVAYGANGLVPSNNDICLCLFCLRNPLLKLLAVFLEC